MNFDSVVCKIHDELGGRSDIDAVALHVRDAYPDVYADKAYVAFKGLVRNALRRVNPETGLPHALSTGDDYVATEQLSFDEFEWICADYLRRSRANRRMAQRLADQCQAVHGVRVDLDALDRHAS